MEMDDKTGDFDAQDANSGDEGLGCSDEQKHYFLRQ